MLNLMILPVFAVKCIAMYELYKQKRIYLRKVTECNMIHINCSVSYSYLSLLLVYRLLKLQNITLKEACCVLRGYKTIHLGKWKVKMHFTISNLQNKYI